MKVTINPFEISQAFLLPLVFMGANLQVYRSPPPCPPATLPSYSPHCSVWCLIVNMKSFMLYFGHVLSYSLSLPVISGVGQADSRMSWLDCLFFLQNDFPDFFSSSSNWGNNCGDLKV